ncbi:MAG: lactonase family protein [Wenyingzhuangia sp.]|uniref:lactonase family protein n=1 Tax=Wenyingzhuangia sp. TaxID=1964193 RepID=UPI0032196043
MMMSVRSIYHFISRVIFIFVLVGCIHKKETTLLFVGSFTDKKPGEGIHVYAFDNETGESTLKFVLDSVVNTSFLKLSKNGEYLYSVIESQMPYHGKVGVYAIDSVQGKIDLVDTKDCGGLNPAHIALDKTGRFLANSNYSDGSLSLFKIRKNGRLSSDPQVLRFVGSSVIQNRQTSSHIHSANFSPDNQFLFAQDLGSDRIRSFSLDFSQQDSILQERTQIQMKPGSGPRHFVFHPNGSLGYSISELSGKITVFRYQNGALEFVKDYHSYQTRNDIYRAADIHISPDGKFLYASNRDLDENSISIFSINSDNGELKVVDYVSTGGNHPRNFAISPSGKFLIVANQFSNNIIIYRRDIISGKLERLPHKITVGQPSSIQMRTYQVSA